MEILGISKTPISLGLSMKLTFDTKLTIYLLQAAPGALEAASSKLWMYRSMLTQQTDANSGLVGPIIITRAANANLDGTPKDVDTEIVTLFQVSYLIPLPSPHVHP